jgi:membrane fusion protein (multidrug efflux system)
MTENTMATGTPSNKRAAPPNERPSADRTKPAGKPFFKIVLILLILLIAAVALRYYIYQRAYENTDNAFIDGEIIQIGPRVAGPVIKVHVKDNQHVNQGDLLLEIDPQDYQTRLSEAQARLNDLMAKGSAAKSNSELTAVVTDAVLIQADAALGAARQQVKVLAARLAQDQANIQAAEANLQQATARKTAVEADASRAAADAVRYKALYQKDEISRQLLDRAEADARASAANLDAARQTVSATQAQLAQARALQSATQATQNQAEIQVQQAEGKVREAQSAPQQRRARESDFQAALAQIEQQRAVVRQAELNLSYVRIHAPEAGYVTKKSVEPGNFVQIGQALMALVSDRMWVPANFKDTQLTHMRGGQSVTIGIDAYPQLKLRGHVESIQSGTGARFSLLPAENATGNYVKVIQRVPVKIVFDESLPAGFKIGPGMSVVPEVRVR